MTQDTATGFEVINTRHLTFAPEVVFDAFADPGCLAQWWGPEGFTNEIVVFDFRPGGALHITMTNEVGTRFENVKQFLDIVRPQRIVMRHIQPTHDFTLAVDFDGVGEGTSITWRMAFAPGSDPDLHDFLHAANEQNFDRLEAFLNGAHHD